VVTVSTEIEPSERYHRPSTAMRQASSSNDPPTYPMPRERSAKSAMVVPAVVDATIVAQYRKG
jgi:hypothetical protein